LKTYIVTFYSHFSAIRFQKILTADSAVRITLMPVPRILSSSCGTCAQIVTPEDFINYHYDGLEKVYSCENAQYKLIYEA